MAQRTPSNPALFLFSLSASLARVRFNVPIASLQRPCSASSIAVSDDIACERAAGADDFAACPVATNAKTEQAAPLIKIHLVKIVHSK
jgi:hypothetical protein